MSERKRGTVKWWDSEKGYGFITFITLDGYDEIFVHYSSIEGYEYPNLEAGDRVEFEIKEGQKAPYAVNVRRYIS